MFYKNSNRSTVLGRIGVQRNDHQNPKEDLLLDLAERVVEADKQTPPPPKNTKLSAFERELLQAWAQD
jgi:hypothetical protein